MSYQLKIKKSAKREAKELPSYIREKAIDAMLSLQENPLPPGIKKLKNKDGYRVRVGDYRILYTVDNNQKIVEIYGIGHRKEVYRKN